MAQTIAQLFDVDGMAFSLYNFISVTFVYENNVVKRSVQD